MPHDRAVPLPLPAPGTAADRPPGARRAAAFRAGVVAFSGLVAYTVAHAFALPGVPTCAFKLWTGLPCPGCGMTRSVFDLAHGDVAGAFRMHPLGLVVAALAVAVLASALWGAVTGRDPVWRFLDRRGSWVALAFVFALAALWIVRVFVVPSWSPDPVGPDIFASR